MGIDTKQAISRRQFTAGTLAASALAMLAGCSGEAGAGAGSASSGSSSSDRVFRCYLSEPAYIDPNNAQETQGALVVHALFDPLVTWDWSTNAAVPLAADLVFRGTASREVRIAAGLHALFVAF